MSESLKVPQAPTVLPIQYRGRHDLLGQARVRLEMAGDHLAIPRGLRDRMFAPHRVVQTFSPVRMDDGEIRVFPGYRVEHSNVLGPYYGGVRFHPEVDLDAITALALLRTWQCALLGIPFGGAKGGVTVDPFQLSDGEMERLTRRFTSDMVTVFDPHQDIPSPDLQTSEREMAWMMDTVSVNRGYAVSGAVTGKPLSIGGTLGSREGPGRGIFMVSEAYFRQTGRSLQGAQVAIEGFGKIGRVAAQLMHQAGARVVAVSDRSGGLHNPAGIDIDALTLHTQRSGLIVGFAGAEPIDVADLMTLPVDLLVPASVSCQITKSNAEKIQAKVICEGANMPTTPEADLILERRGVTVIPDMLANAGGAIMGYFEWVQDNNQLFWIEDEVNERLRSVIMRAYQKVIARAEKDALSLRMAAHAQAVHALHEALIVRGLYP